jgi:hypothetical protein
MAEVFSGAVFACGTLREDVIVVVHSTPQDIWVLQATTCVAVRGFVRCQAAAGWAVHGLWARSEKARVCEFGVETKTTLEVVEGGAKITFRSGRPIESLTDEWMECASSGRCQVPEERSK